MADAASGALVVQTSFLGDMVLTTPLLESLARSAVTVDVLATPVTAPLLANNPHVRDVIVYDKRGRDRGPAGFARLARLLRAKRYARAYLAQGSVRSGALVALAAIPVRVGFATSAGRVFYTRRIRYDDTAHHAARLEQLAWDLVTPRGQPRPRLYPGAADRSAVDALLREAVYDGDVPIIALAPGSVWGTKRWPGYVEVAKALGGQALLVVVGGAADAPLAGEIIRGAGAEGVRAIDATGKLSLLASAELIARATALVTNDSAPLHLASAVGTPTIAVFGPTVPAFGFGPLAPRSAIAEVTTLTCRPCDRHGPARCPLGHWRCMREITPDRVVTLLRGILGPPATFSS